MSIPKAPPMASIPPFLTRRRTVASALAWLAALATHRLGRSATAITSGKESMIGKIDTHHHFLPKVYVDAVGLADLASVMPNGVAPSWSIEAALRAMDDIGTAEAILSISSGPRVPDAPAVLRACNEHAAELRSRHAGRFGSFASLPLPDIDASLKEVAYSLNVLKADGFILFSSYEGKYLGNPQFAPLLEELNRHSAVVFIHPNHPPYELPELPPASVLEFPFDTTRTAVSLIMSGALRRYPNIRFILSHAGGTLPFLASRISGAVAMNPAVAERVGDPMLALRAFYYDLAVSASPAQFAALMTIAQPSHVLFGTDFPMAPDFVIKGGLEFLEHGPLDNPMRAAIFRGNAARLLARN